MCAIFTLIVFPPVYKNPISQIYNYPPAIIKRVKSLPQYKDQIPTNQTKLARKMAGVFIFIGLLTAVTYFSGMTTFKAGFLYSFGLWLVIDWYDALILDSLLFAHMKRFRIPGTEDMVKEYKSPWFHIIGSCKGMVIGAVVCLIVGLIIHIMK
mgnify:CR=1 FL=1